MACLLRVTGLILFTLAALAQEKNSAPAPATEKWKISGIVVDATSSTPLAGVEVALAAIATRNDFRTTTTAEDGRFAFDNLGPGKYTLTGQRKGYVREFFDQHAQYSTSIAVGPKLQSENLFFRLHRDASISGTVTDDQNEPVRNAEITLLQESIFNGEIILRARGTANDEGVYHFGHLTPGKYFVAVSCQPWYAQRPYRFSSKTTRTITDNGTTEIRGTNDHQDAAEEQQRNSPLDVAYPVTFYPGATEFEAAAPIVLSSGDRFTADLNLRAVPAIHLQITGSIPVQGGNAQVQAHIPGGVDMPVRSTSMQVEPGVMEVSGLVPGHYFLHMNLYDGKNWSNSSKEVTVSGDARITVDEKDSYVPLSGTLKLEPLGPFPERGQVIFRNKASGRRFFATISIKGEFEVDRGVLAGRYEISVSAIDYFLKSMTATGGRVAGRILDVTTGTPVKLTLEMTQGLGQINGVALKNDTPLGSVMVVLVPQDPVANPQYFRRDQSDSDGTFTLASVVPGKYTAIAIENGWDLQWGNPKALKPYMAQGTPVQVEPKGKYDIKVKIQSVYTQ